MHLKANKRLLREWTVRDFHFESRKEVEKYVLAYNSSMLVEISTRRSRNLRKKEKEKKRKRSVESSDGLEIRIRNEYLDRDDRGSIVHTHDDVIYRRKRLEN